MRDQDAQCEINKQTPVLEEERGKKVCSLFLVTLTLVYAIFAMVCLANFLRGKRSEGREVE